jgi:outer membrane receptor for monomeric catechols
VHKVKPSRNRASGLLVVPALKRLNNKLNNTTTMKQAIAYSTKNKTYCITSIETAQAMLFMGNPYGFNRATTFPASSANQMASVMESNGFKLID